MTKEEKINLLKGIESESERNVLLTEILYRTARSGGLSVNPSEKGLSNRQYRKQCEDDMATFKFRLAATREILKEIEEDTFTI